MVSRQETARALLTPGELMQLPRDEEIVLVSGLPPIRATKVRCYEDRRLTARILPPPQLERVDCGSAPGAAADRATKDDWTALPASGKEAGAAHEDPANGGVRREPELPEHGEIAPPEPSFASAPETFLTEETQRGRTPRRVECSRMAAAKILAGSMAEEPRDRCAESASGHASTPISVPTPSLLNDLGFRAARQALALLVL